MFSGLSDYIQTLTAAMARLEATLNAMKDALIAQTAALKDQTKAINSLT
jgi:outer membrane murein-binding lipoprotein Lpp